MKQRRLTIATFLVLAITILSVGFAALNDNLLFDGSANVNTDAAQAAFDGNVYFSECSTSDARDTASIISGTVDAEVNDTIQFHVASLGVKDNSAVIYGTIVNKSERFDADVKLNNIAIGGANSDKFSVKCYEVGGSDAEITSLIGINVPKSSGGTLSTKQVKIVVTLLDSPNDSAFSATIAVRLDVTAVDPQNA